MTLAAVVLNYNYGRFLADAVASLQSQTVAFDDIVVVDDGSTDDSREILEGLGVRVVAKDNGGQLSAAIAGLRAVDTDHVYFLDADDVALPQLVELVGPHLSADCVKVQFPLQAVDADLVPTGSVFPSFGEGYSSADMVVDNRRLGFYTCPPTSGNVFSRAALLGLDLDDLDHRDFIDGVPALVMPYLGEIASVHTPLAGYRIHGANHSAWARPDAAQLEHEIAWFADRWTQACRLLGRSSPPWSSQQPLYVTERRLMLTAMGTSAGVGGRIRLVGAVATAFARSHLPPWQRASLCAWALSFLLPVPAVNTAAVRARRSPGDRPRAVSAVLGFVRRLRRRGQP